jgi:hypothetical protein
MYEVTDGLNRYEFLRGTAPAAFAQARGFLVMDPRLDSDLAELHVWHGDTWESLGRVLQLPRQAPYVAPADSAMLA